MTPDTAVSELVNHPEVAKAVRDFIVSRAPETSVAGGRATLGALIDGIMTDWRDTAEERTAGGSAFAYGHKKSPQRLLHQPLEADLEGLPAAHRRFVAGRSMRDVEAAVRM